MFNDIKYINVNYISNNGILERGENRYNKTLKNRNLRIQGFCLSIGFVISYIIYFVLLAMKGSLPEALVVILNNKYTLIRRYIGECEVHIGKYSNCGKNREIIEKIYKIARIIVLVQLIISIIMFIVLK